jgi:hypothetical protein
MFGFARILSLLVALAFVLAPLAPVAAQCADQITQSEMSAMQDMSCCPSDDQPDEPVVCKAGCIQVIALIGFEGRSTAVPVAGYLPGYPAAHTEWLTPPDLDPPKANLLS